MLDKLNWDSPSNATDKRMPSGLQVTVLDVLDQEGALHLLPSPSKAPTCSYEAFQAAVEQGSGSSQTPAAMQGDKCSRTEAQALYLSAKPPAEVVRVYRGLLDNGGLQKAGELGSLPHVVAVHWTGEDHRPKNK